MTAKDIILQSLEEKTRALEEEIKKSVLTFGKNKPRLIVSDLLEPLVVDYKREILFVEKINGMREIVSQYKERIRNSGLEVIYT